MSIANKDLRLNKPNLGNIRSTFKTSRCNSYNIKEEDIWNTWNKHMKHLRKQLKNIWKPLQIYTTSRWNIWKHTYETSESAWNIWLQYACICNIETKTLATFISNRWNIWNIHLKHTYIGITTCATSRSTFATSIYNTCNIPRKHLKHLKHTIATCAFNVASACYLDMLVDVEHDVSTQLEAMEWRGVRRCGARRQHRPRQG
jgi:YesN/AraC family two-component response regulator